MNIFDPQGFEVFDNMMFGNHFGAGKMPDYRVQEIAFTGAICIVSGNAQNVKGIVGRMIRTVFQGNQVIMIFLPEIEIMDEINRNLFIIRRFFSIYDYHVCQETKLLPQGRRTVDLFDDRIRKVLRSGFKGNFRP